MNCLLQIPTLVIFSILLSGAGCSSVNLKSSAKLKSTRDPAAVRKVERLFVVINQGETENTKLSDMLIEHFRNTLDTSPVQVEFTIMSPLDLDERVHDAKIKQFNADAILTISIATFTVYESGGYPTLYYDVSLFDPELKKRFWRASVNNSGATWRMNQRMRDLAIAIVSQLRKDGFLL